MNTVEARNIATWIAQKITDHNNGDEQTEILVKNVPVDVVECVLSILDEARTTFKYSSPFYSRLFDAVMIYYNSIDSDKKGLNYKKSLG